jgi:hypothetical protein
MASPLSESIVLFRSLDGIFDPIRVEILLTFYYTLFFMRKENLFDEFESERLESIYIPEIGPTSIVPVDESMRGCVDPRPVLPLFPLTRDRIPLSERQRARYPISGVRSAGATAGVTMAGLALRPDVPVAEMMNLVTTWERARGRQVTIHGDTYGIQTQSYDGGHTCGLGCGHIDRARQPENARLYGVSAKRIEELLHLRAREHNENPQVINAPILGGVHAEPAVLIVDSDTHTVDPQNAFRYDRKLFHRQLRDLSQFAAGQGVRMHPDQLIEIADRQAMATLGLLAPGLPIQHVILEGNQRMVQPLGVVPTVK